MACQLTAERVSSIVKFLVFVAMGPSLLGGGEISTLCEASTQSRELGSRLLAGASNAAAHWLEQNPAHVLTPIEIQEAVMGFGRGALLWLLGVPLPIIILLAIFMHH